MAERDDPTSPAGGAGGSDEGDAQEPAEGAGAAATASVAGGILASRLTGLARERAIGHFLGTGAAADAFAVAFRVPNLLQHLLGEGVLSATFIPVYSRLLAEGREDEAADVAGAVLGLLSLATGVLVLVGVLAAEPVTAVVAAGLRDRPETFALTVRLVRILFPAVGLLVLSAWCLGVLNSHRRFFLSYVAPALLNVVQVAVMVGAALTVLPVTLPVAERQAGLVTWLAVGTVIGGLGQVLVQLPTVLRVARRVRPSLRRDLPGVRRTLGDFVPVAGARGVVQLSAYLSVFLASFLAAGSLAVLRYAQTMYGLPIALFGMAVAAAELPEFGRRGADDTDAAGRRLRAALVRVTVLVVPATVAYLVIGDLLVGALFGSGRFSESDATVVWIVLAAYSLGLLASTSSRVVQSALYGAGDPRTPSRAAVVRVLVAASVGAVVMLQLDRVALTADGLELVGSLPAWTPLAPELRATAGPRLGAAGLGVGAALASWVEYALLRRAVQRRVGRCGPDRDTVRRVALAAAASAVVGLGLRPLVRDLPVVVAGLLAAAVTGLAYVGVASRLDVPQLPELRRALRRPGGRG